MSVTKQAIDLATRGELENMMVLDALPYSSLTCIFGFKDEYKIILKLLLRALNCIKLVASKKSMKIDIRAFVEMPKDYQSTPLYKKWERYNKTVIGYNRDFKIDELRSFYPQMVECHNFYIESLINRGESIDFVKEWKGILAKCASQHPDSNNRFKVVEAHDPMGIAVKPFQILRGAKLIKIEELSSFKDTKVNGRFEIAPYMYISNIDNLINFLTGSIA